jgi:hypothetical protein
MKSPLNLFVGKKPEKQKFWGTLLALSQNRAVFENLGFSKFLDLVGILS